MSATKTYKITFCSLTTHEKAELKIESRFIWEVQDYAKTLEIPGFYEVLKVVEVK